MGAAKSLKANDNLIKKLGDRAAKLAAKRDHMKKKAGALEKLKQAEESLVKEIAAKLENAEKNLSASVDAAKKAKNGVNNAEKKDKDALAKEGAAKGKLAADENALQSTESAYKKEKETATKDHTDADQKLAKMKQA